MSAPEFRAALVALEHAARKMTREVRPRLRTTRHEFTAFREERVWAMMKLGDAEEDREKRERVWKALETVDEFCRANREEEGAEIVNEEFEEGARRSFGRNIPIAVTIVHGLATLNDFVELLSRMNRAAEGK